MNFKILFFALVSSVLISCGGGDTQKNNPVIAQWENEFGIPPFEDISYKHFKAAYFSAFEAQSRNIDSIVNNTKAPDFENVILAFDTSALELERVDNLFEFYSNVAMTKDMLKIKGEINLLKNQHRDEIYFNEKLFEKIESVNKNSTRLTAPKRKLTEEIYNKFIRQGAKLESAAKNRLKTINVERVELENQYFSNTFNNSKSVAISVSKPDISSIHSDVRTISSRLSRELKHGDEFVFLNDESYLNHLLLYHKDEKIRRSAAEAYDNFCCIDTVFNNKDLVLDIVSLRQEEAKIKGYENYLDFIMTFTGENAAESVVAKLDSLINIALVSAKDELGELLAKSRPGAKKPKVTNSDWLYYSNEFKKTKHQQDALKIRPYFPVGNVRDGIFHLSNRLFGLTFRPIFAPEYDELTMSYEVFDMDNTHLGVIYLDLFTRLNKTSGTWTKPIVSKNMAKGQSAVVGLSMDFTVTNKGNAANTMLTPEQVTEFFNEFGNALFYLFRESPYRTYFEDDFALEQFSRSILGNWALTSELLASYAINHGNVVMPNKEIAKLQNVKKISEGYYKLRNLSSAVLDLELHRMKKDTIEFDFKEFELSLLHIDREIPIQINPKHKLTNFDKVFYGDYAARYYAAPFAEDDGRKFFERFSSGKDVFDRKLAGELRDKLSAR